jgi:energy-coupling factor transport system ATP-binding protein
VPPCDTASIAGASLEVVGVTHVYAARTPWAQSALADLDFRMAPGEGWLIVGGNGSGKSTLAWILAGLIRPTAGQCLVDGRPAADQVGRVGLAFQHPRLQVLRQTVLADVRAAGGVDAVEAEAALRSVGLDPAEVGDRAVERLSGGQLRRVALAGLLARRPGALVLDEPLAGLDDDGRAATVGVLDGLRRAGMTLVVISHDLAGLEAVCDRTLRLVAGRATDATTTAAGGGSRS